MVAHFRSVLDRLKGSGGPSRSGWIWEAGGPPVQAVVDSLRGKKALEVGGPSDALFATGARIPIYPVLRSLDNVRFALDTAWTSDRQFRFDWGRRQGKLFIGELQQLSKVVPKSYEALISADVLEHTANPLRGLREMLKVVLPGSPLFLVLPYYKRTFDHRRQPTPLEHLLEDERRDVGEDDLTHLDEILQCHDLSMDVPAGTLEQLRERSLHNAENRCLHHHVFDEANLASVLSYLSLRPEFFQVEKDKMLLLIRRC